MPRKGHRRVRDLSCSNTQILTHQFVATPTRSAFSTRHAKNRTRVDRRSVSGKLQTRCHPSRTKTNVQTSKFSSWNKLAKPGELEYYTKQRYTQGTKCWNGPQRSVEVVILVSSFACLLTTVCTSSAHSFVWYRERPTNGSRVGKVRVPNYRHESRFVSSVGGRGQER